MPVLHSSNIVCSSPLSSLLARSLFIGSPRKSTAASITAASNAAVASGTLVRKQCNCKNSKCLKLSDRQMTDGNWQHGKMEKGK